MADDFARSKASLQATSLNFIETELELVRTFCKISKETDDADTRARNIHNAEKALQSAVKSFRDFNEQTRDWADVRAALDDAERQLNCCR